MIITPQYWAGFFDGEGCISCSRNDKGTLHVSVSITNTNLSILDALARQYGGKVYFKNKYSTKHSQAYSWQTQKYSNFISDILPFLLIKKEQALLALDFLRTIDKSVNKKGLSDEVKLKREEIKILLNHLNKRGI